LYAVIRTGGKQYKVAQGDVIEVERLRPDSGGVEFAPLLVVDDDGHARAGSAELGSATVKARVVGERRGDKIRISKYRSKTGYRRRAGHRQTLTSIEISEIALGGSSGAGDKE
jgi:large subunit ribosomal protein L21